jgi:hypothetical protein
MIKKSGFSAIPVKAVLAVMLVLSLAFTACPPPSPPELWGSVSITGASGLIFVGQTLTADTTALEGTGTISYQWKRGTTDISGATGSTYTPVLADVGTYITVQVSRAGYSGTVTGSGAGNPVTMAWKTVGNSTFGATAINGIAYGNNLWVAVGASGKMATSLNGSTWTAVGDSTFGASAIYGIAYGIAHGNNLWVAVGLSGKIAISPDGSAWTLTDINTFSYSSQIRGIAYRNNLWVAVGVDGKMAYLDD